MINFDFDGVYFNIYTTAYHLKLNRQGGIVSLSIPEVADVVLGGKTQPLWRARQNNGLIHFSTDMLEPDYQWSDADKSLILDYSSDDLSVQVHFQATETYVDLKAEITRHAGDVIKYFFLPDRVEFPVTDMNQFLYPKTWGLSLSPDFFRAYKSYTTGYPGPMDFMHIDSQHGQLSLYGVQTIRDREPYDRSSDCLVPGRLFVEGVRRQGPPVGALSHGWNVWVDAGQTFTTPVYRLAVGQVWTDSVRAYGEANQITRTLADKVNDDLLTKIKSAYIVKYEKDTWADFRAALDRLPAPSIIHFAGHLPNGFDRYYPKHLPFNPDMGTEQDFIDFCNAARDAGHITMPYTNYTWWCYDTPYLQQYGEQALQKRLDGYPLMEFYYEQMGYAVSQWSPIHQQIMFDEVERQKVMGIDILSVDQMSARPFKPPFMTEDYWWDMNSACPTPYAAPQGMADTAKKLHDMLPVSTEVWDNGPIDYLMNWVMQFCGKHIDGLHEPDIRFAPLCHMLAHDKTIFTWHDLAQDTSTWNDYRLSLSLVLGFQLIYVEGSRGEPVRAHRNLFSTYQPDDADWPDETAQDWLSWLHQLSTTVVNQYIGEPMTAFRYLADEVMQATYGSVTVTANLSQSPYTLTENIAISPEGFYARAEGVEAGLLDQYHNRNGERMRIFQT